MINSSEYIVEGRPLKDYTYNQLSGMMKLCRKYFKSSKLDSNLAEIIKNIDSELKYRDFETPTWRCAGTGGYYPEYRMNWRQKIILILGLN